MYPSRWMPFWLRKWFCLIGARMLNCGIDFVYRNEDEASKDILNFANQSYSVKVLSIRGKRLTSEERPLSVLLKNDQAFEEITVLLADPEFPALKDRGTGFADENHTYTAELYTDDVFSLLGGVA